MAEGRAALTVADKHAMSASEVVRACPHAPEVANPCPCGIEWCWDINGDWAIVTRWANGYGR